MERAKKQSVGIKDKHGNIKTEKNDIMERWKEHFCEILKRGDPESPIREEEIDEVEEIEDKHIGRFTKEEVRTALRNTRNGKAAGVDQVGPELLKADMEETTNRLHKLFNKLCETETWPNLWKQGLIIKIFKKGDLRDCNNWRGVTFLPVISKVFSRLLINRLKERSG